MYFRISLYNYLQKPDDFQDYPSHILISLYTVFSHQFRLLIPLFVDQIYTFHLLIPHIVFIFHQEDYFFYLILHSNFILNLIALNTFFLKTIICLNHSITSQFTIFIIQSDLFSIIYGFHILIFLLKMIVINLFLTPFNRIKLSISLSHYLFLFLPITIFQFLLTI